MNFIVTNRMFLKPEYNQEFEQRFKDRAGQIDKQSGFVRDLSGVRTLVRSGLTFCIS